MRLLARRRLWVNGVEGVGVGTVTVSGEHNFSLCQCQVPVSVNDHQGQDSQVSGQSSCEGQASHPSAAARNRSHEVRFPQSRQATGQSRDSR